MKVHILVDFKCGPWGGGNQFLKALKSQFVIHGCYADDPNQAEIILFNSHHKIKNVIKLKRKYPEKIFIHRVDGPMSYRGKSGEKLDKYIFNINSIIADGTVFQSEWSRQESYKKGMRENRFEAIIHNAPDPDIFFSQQKKPLPENKIKLIATSWSNDPKKGFDIYHYLDNNLDFDKYIFNFIGKIDKPFENLNIFEPMPSSELAEQLRNHDIFIFASETEACSNSLLEAIHCGLSVVARNTSSNPEILFNRGEVFNGEKDILKKIDYVAKNINNYNEMLVSHNGIKKVEQLYNDLCTNICKAVKEGQYNSKSINYFDYIRLKI